MDTTMMKHVLRIAAVGLLLASAVGVVRGDETNSAAATPTAVTNMLAGAAKPKPKRRAHIQIQIGKDGEADGSNSIAFDEPSVGPGDSGASIPGEAVLIVGIVFGCPVAIVALLLTYRHRKQVLLHRTLAAMIEKGTPIPPELLTGDKRTPRSDLRRAITLMCVGLGLTVFFLAQHDDVWGIGAIPLLIGVGYLIVWKIERNKPNEPN